VGELVPEVPDVPRVPGIQDPTSPAVARRDVRVSDKERHAVVDELRVHFGEGRIDLAEFEERTNAALTARVKGDLVPLLDDLPYLRTQPMMSGPPVRERQPRSPAAGAAAFRTHLYIWLVLSAFWTVIWMGTTVFGDGDSPFWPIYPIAAFGLTVGIHAAVRKGSQGA
jgi:DUF1707 SHOCT-like domain